MIRRPDTAHALVQTRHRLLGSLQLLAASLLEDHSLLHNFAGLEIAYTDSFLEAIDVMTLDNGVLRRSGGNADFNLGVFAGKGGEILRQEVAIVVKSVCQ